MNSSAAPTPPHPSASALFSQFNARVRNGETLSIDAFCAEHPAQADDLRELHSIHQGLALSIETQALVSASEADATAEALLASYQGRKPLFAARYKLLDARLGAGGMGVVLKALDLDVGREVAIKIIRDQDALLAGGRRAEVSRAMLARFLNEARITGQLEHPSIVPVHEIGVDGEGRPFFAMKLVHGRHLGKVLSEAREPDSSWTRERVLDVLSRVCEALAYAHEKEIVHRDLKPSNVMIGDFGEVYVMDWGLAKRIGAPEPVIEASETPDLDVQLEDAARTNDGRVVGTAYYMSPEQASGDRARMGTASDVYAVGAMLYELIAGKPPFHRDGESSTPTTIRERLSRWELDPLPNEGVPAELQAICKKAMARDVLARYRDMLELARDLRAYLDGRVVQAYETGAWAETKKWVQRNKALAASTASAAGIALVGFLWVAAKNEELVGANTELAERKRRVLEASALNELQLLMDDANQLWPLFDDAVLKRSENWIAHAEALRDGTTERVGRDGFRAQLAALREHGRELTQAEKDERKKGDPRYERLDRAERQLALAQAVQQRRSKGVRLFVDEPPPVPPDWLRLPPDWEGLNRRAWEIVDWIDRKGGADDELALQMARKARDLAREVDAQSEPDSPRHEWRVIDTLAWCAFRNGFDEEARALSKQAQDMAPSDAGEPLAQSQALLAEALAVANSDSGKAAMQAEITKVNEELRDAQLTVADVSDWVFESAEDQWRHDYLTHLLARMHECFDERRGLMSGTEHPESLSVAARVAWTRTALGWLGDPRINALWKDAQAAVAADKEHYAELELQPIPGVIPLGKSAKTGLLEFYVPIVPAYTELALPRSPDAVSDDGFVFVLIPGGRFQMGMQSTDRSRSAYGMPSGSEQPPVDDEFRGNGEPAEVVLEPFLLSKFETTQAQWERLTNANPSILRAGSTYAGVRLGPQHPVNGVSWTLASTVLSRIGATLPTEAQWERAALAGAGWREWTDADLALVTERANTADLAMSRAPQLEGFLSIRPEVDDGHPILAPAGALLPNAWGLHDMQGNAWEWCRDFYGSYDEPVEPGTGERLPYPRTYRVLRGGGAFESWSESRIPRRNHDSGNNASLESGVRIAIDLPHTKPSGAMTRQR